MVSLIRFARGRFLHLPSRAQSSDAEDDARRVFSLKEETQLPVHFFLDDSLTDGQKRSLQKKIRVRIELCLLRSCD